jgi:hypothetical protein
MSARVTGELVKPAHMSESLLRKRLKSGKCRVDGDGVLEKYCSRCKEYWPADTEFYFSMGSKGDGLSTWCKACYLEWRYPDGRGAVGHQFGTHSNHEQTKEESI